MKLLKECPYCSDGKSTGLPGNACENCMNTELAEPQLSVVDVGDELHQALADALRNTSHARANKPSRDR